MRLKVSLFQCVPLAVLLIISCGRNSEPESGRTPADMPPPSGGFNGLDMNLGNLCRLSHAQSRSISAENFSGEKGKGGMATEGIGNSAARELGQGWKVSPAVCHQGQVDVHLGGDQRIGAIQQIWFAHRRLSTGPVCSSSASIGTARPSPRSKFRWAISSPAAGASIARSTRCPSASIPAARLNCYWTMPFRKKAKITAGESRRQQTWPSAIRSTTCSPTCPRMRPISTPSSAA